MAGWTTIPTVTGGAGGVTGAAGAAGAGAAAGGPGGMGGVGGVAGAAGGSVDAGVGGLFVTLWNFDGRAVTQVDVKWCPGFSLTCGLCNVSAVGSPDAGPLPVGTNFYLRDISCAEPGDAGADAAPGVVAAFERPQPIAQRVGPTPSGAAGAPCLGQTHGPDGGLTAVTETVLRPQVMPYGAFAVCDFVPNGAVTGCELPEAHCVGDCSACP
jgi:hypothetical protein